MPVGWWGQSQATLGGGFVELDDAGCVVVKSGEREAVGWEGQRSEPGAIQLGRDITQSANSAKSTLEFSQTHSLLQWSFPGYPKAGLRSSAEGTRAPADCRHLAPLVAVRITFRHALRSSPSPPGYILEVEPSRKSDRPHP